MYYRIIRNDISKSKLITIIATVFIVAAAMLVSLAVILVVNLSGAIDTLMRQAETPHFLQMHSGEIDRERLAAFAEQNNSVDEFQVLEFLNVDGAQIVIGDDSLANSVQDNGFATQSEQFDYLLDLDGKIIAVSDGELYAPVAYLKEGIARIGDTAVINGKKLTITGFLRDSQMNSMLASSKRFLVSENDFVELEGFGNTEYLIEFRLKDLGMLSAFETSYIAAGLESNGPTITYPLFRSINAISDGMMIAVLLLVSVLVVAVAFMCIRFTLLAKIEDDYREIGVMKAIGLPLSDIKMIYLAKYSVVAAVGCVTGFALSLAFRGMLLENIRLYMGGSGNSSLALILGVIAVLLVFLAIIAFVSGVLNRFRKISAAEAIRFGISQEKSGDTKHLSLSKNRLLDINIFLGIKDVLTRKRLYVTMLAVLVISAFIIIVPQNLYTTISSSSFIEYMGIGMSDIRVDIQQVDNISGRTAEIAAAISADDAISKYVVNTTKAFDAKRSDGTKTRINIELGDHSIFPVQYPGGRVPVAEDEIALSALNADELGMAVGDELTLDVGGNEKTLVVSGIYSDITNGGKTAKATFTDNSAGIIRSNIYAELTDPALVSAKVSQYAERFNFAKISDIDAYTDQVFGTTISSVGMASYMAIAVALMIMAIVTLLFMRMFVAKDRFSIAVMKALGFTRSDIVKQYMTRSVFVLIVGSLLGTLLANTLGEVLASGLISTFGVTTFNFEVNPLTAYLISPLMMIAAVLIATVLGTSGVGQIKVSENIKE